MNNLNLYTINEIGLSKLSIMITRGLFRFNIIGIKQTQINDVKDRVYSSLRSVSLLNLRGDNRRILVNITPEIQNKSCKYIDLAIAVLCLKSMINKNLINDNCIIIGELDINGNVLASNHILKAILLAKKNFINKIICSEKDAQILQNLNIDINDLEIYSLNNISDLNKSISSLILEKKFNKNPVNYISNTISETISETISNTISDAETNYFKNLPINIKLIVLSIITNTKLLIKCTLYSNFDTLLSRLKNVNIDSNIILNCVENNLSNENYCDSRIIEINNNNMLKSSILSELKANFNINSISSIRIVNHCPCGFYSLLIENKFFSKNCLCNKKMILDHNNKIVRNSFIKYDLIISTFDKINVDNDIIENINNIIINFDTVNINSKDISPETYIHDNLKLQYGENVTEKIIKLSKYLCFLENKNSIDKETIELILKHINI